MALAVLGALTACGTAGGPRSTPAAAHRLCSAARSAELDCGLYIAVRATDGGRTVGWLPTMPIRLWFEPLNGARTAILDAPVNTYNVPTLRSGSTLWSSGVAAGTAVGCSRHCDADGFVGAITNRSAQYAVDSGDGAITITGSDRTIRFEPTTAPADPKSCAADSIDELPCTRLVSVTATDAGAVVDALRTDPVTATVTGIRGHHTVHLRTAGGAAWTLPLTAATDGFRSAPASPAGSTRAAGTGTVFLADLFRHVVSWQPHFGSLLLTAGTRTLQLEPTD